MNAKEESCFLCLEQANNIKISICEDCVYNLVCNRGTCCDRIQELEPCDGMIHLESLNGSVSKESTLNGVCHGDDSVSRENSVMDNQELNTVITKDLLNHNKTALGTMNKMMDEFNEKQSVLNNKIHRLNLNLDRNNEEIEEIKATIQTTTLQLKMLIADQENALLSCLDSYFSEVSRQARKQKNDLQSAIEEVNESIEITQEMLRKKGETKSRVLSSALEHLIKHDDYSGICDDDDDDMRSASFSDPPKQRIIPEGFNYLMSFEGQLEEPVGVTSTPDGLLYIADYNNDCIRVFDLTGQAIRTLTHVTADSGRETPFLCPTGLACDKAGNLVIAERARHRITVTSPDGKLKYKFGKMGKAHSQLRDPHGVTVDRIGRVIVADTSNSRIQVYDKNGDFVFTFGDKGEEKLDYPTYVVFHKGLFFVSDTDNDAVKVYNKDGCYLRRLSNHLEGAFSAPSGLAIYQADYILVCDYNNDCVKMFSLDGHFICKFGSAGNGPGQFCGPEAITVSHDNKIIVTDKNNSRVQIFEVIPLLQAHKETSFDSLP